MRKVLITTLIVAIILILALALFRQISFSETNGVVWDEFGNAIVDAKVSISYSCPESRFMDTGSHSFKTQTIQTDNSGQFSFDSLNIGFASRLKYPAGCEKIISTYKEGYCKDIQLCTRVLNSGGITKEQIGPKYDAIKSNFLYKNKLYYESAYFHTSTTITSYEKIASLSLNKFDLWFQS